MSERTFWYAPDLTIVDEPLAKAMLNYRQNNRTQLPRPSSRSIPLPDQPNLISSKTDNGKQMPILDLDFPHHYEVSTTSGHGHLYLDQEMSNLRWFVLMCALRFAGVIEKGYFAWGIRRWGNFVRVPGLKKKSNEEATYYSYGWFFKLREKK
jgi:hypothetical protein